MMREQLLEQCKKTIDTAILDALTGYNSPLADAIKSALSCEAPNLERISKDAVSDLLNSEEFNQTMKIEMKKKLARVLISQFGGELERIVGKLKADPTTRAKITVAIDSVINDLTK